MVERQAKTSGNAGRGAGSSSCARIRVLHEPPRPTSGSERMEAAELQDGKLRLPLTLLADVCLPSVSLFDSRDRSEDSTVAPPVPMTKRDLLIAVRQRHHGREAGCGAGAPCGTKAEVPGRWQLVAPPRNPGTLCTGADPCQAAGGADATALVVRRRRQKRRCRQSSCLEPRGRCSIERSGSPRL